MILLVSTNWLYSNNPYVPEQFVHKEASETHFLYALENTRTNPCAKMAATSFICFNHHQQNIAHSLKYLERDPLKFQGQGWGLWWWKELLIGIRSFHLGWPFSVLTRICHSLNKSQKQRTYMRALLMSNRYSLVFRSWIYSLTKCLPSNNFWWDTQNKSFLRFLPSSSNSWLSGGCVSCRGVYSNTSYFAHSTWS